MRVLIVDDEPLARERLAALVGEIEGAEVVGHAGNGADLLEAAPALQPDVVLLDIRMPVMDGLEAARHLAALDTPPAVVFCTAYDEHALAAFDVDAIDYIVKPVRSERLRQALERARRYGGEQLRRAAAGPGRQRTHLCARVRGSLVLVPVGDVAYLQAEDKYVVIHHGRGQLLIEEPLKDLEEEFGDRFVRIHRNCLIARSRLVGLLRTPDGRTLARLEGDGVELEVSRRSLPGLRKLVKNL